MDHPLARALHSVGLDPVDVATSLGVDPKTVQRWLRGRIPYPRYQEGLVALTGWSAHDLWPRSPRPSELDQTADELRVVYPQRSSVPLDVWCRLFARAEHDIGILAYAALPLAENPLVLRALREKARSGVRVRVLLGDPECAQVARRGSDERVDDLMGSRIRTALVRFRPLASEAGTQVRLHDTVLYNSIYRSDDELLVNPHVYGFPASYAPVLHLRQSRDDGTAATYLTSFERVWSTSKPAP